MDSCTLSAHVLEAHSLGGTKMYEVKVRCKGKSTSTYKSKEDFKSVLDMFRLVGAMARSGKPEEPCAVCAAYSATGLARVCDEDSLDDFLGDALAKLRKASPAAIERCSRHRGVVQILMDFLSVRDGRYFCEYTPEQEQLLSPSNQSPEVDVDHPVARCSLNRTLSEQFAAMDSVC